MSSTAKYQREWRKRNPGKNRFYKYGLTQEAYDSMLRGQDSRCAICNEQKPLQVDHDHQSGVVRGLLCWECNTALGKLHDDLNIARGVVRYLEATCHRLPI